MKSNSQNPSKSLLHTIRNRIISGLIAAIPLLITVFIIKVIFNFLAGILKPLLVLFWGYLPDWIVTIISILLLLVFLYVLGLIASNVFGRKLIDKFEKLLLRLPIVRPIYHASKQVFGSLSMSTRTSFKAVVLVEYPRKGIQSLGFITSVTETLAIEDMANVFIPTTPNPTSGFTIMISRSEVIELDIPLEDAMKDVMSAGIICPEKFIKLSKT